MDERVTDAEIGNGPNKTENHRDDGDEPHLFRDKHPRENYGLKDLRAGNDQIGHRDVCGIRDNPPFQFHNLKVILAAVFFSG
jgi:hypothetical protein